MQKMVTVETVLRIRAGGVNGSSGGSEFKYDIFDTL
jgi:hypothetical protein